MALLVPTPEQIKAMKEEPVSDTPKCDKCGIECTTGMMAAFCSRGRECEFWPHSNGDVQLAGGELLMYRFWMDNTLEQIGLQIEDRKRLERELAELRNSFSDVTKDAERYRHLRAHWDDFTGTTARDPGPWLDATIDAVLSAGRPK